eukprot:tig00020554_g10857.t1
MDNPDSESQGMQEDSQQASQPMQQEDEAVEESMADALLQDEEPNREEEEEEGEDLLENAENDYRAQEGLDAYERDDDAEREAEEAGDMDYEARREAEEQLDRRDARRDRRRRAAFEEEDEDEDDEEVRARARRRRLERLAREQGVEADDIAEEDAAEPIGLNFEDVRGPIRQWVIQQTNKMAIMAKFRKFITKYNPAKDVEAGLEPKYKRAIREMAAKNNQSFVVNYNDMIPEPEYQALAMFVADAPIEVLKIFDEVARKVVEEEFPKYRKISQEVRIRIADLPLHDNLREIRHVHLNCLIRVMGVVTRRTGVFPQLKLVKYDCVKCGFVLGPISQNGVHEVQPQNCPECQSKGPFSINQEQTVYRNFQKIVLQEAPGTVPPGRLPRSKDIILTGDLIDQCRPGEQIEVTGVYTNNFDASLNKKNGFPVFSTVIEANHIESKSKGGSVELTEEDKAEIVRLSKDPQIAERIVASIGPSIYGHDDIKMALAMSLFGGQAKEVPGKHRIRGDINVLLLGDPGTAKSQFLKYAQQTAHRAVFTTGKGASAVGLTAAVHKDPITREWTLEGGALVLADQGVCLIDEFDKMNDQDRTSIHEAMEQQTISISKAGIVTTLQARCAVIAAANPVGGRYNSQTSFQQNVDLTEPILSRFDVLCVVRDLVDPEDDERLAAFVVNSHVKSHPALAADPEARAEREAHFPVPPQRYAAEGIEIIPQSLLRKYIAYARSHCNPVLRDVAVEKLQDLYAELRRESATGDGLTIAVRHLESIIRMSEAHARMHLRDHVKDEDLNVAIRVMLDSFISTQKFSLQRTLRRSFAKFIERKKDDFPLVYHLLRSLFNEKVAYYAAKARQGRPVPDVVEIEQSELAAKAKDRGITDLRWFYTSSTLAEHGYSVANNVIAKAMPPSMRPDAR